MSFNHSSTPPRPVRIILGGLMAITGFTVGMFEASDKFHTALLVQEEPYELDWETLVNEGCGEHAYIRLVNVDLIEPEIELDDFWDEEAIDEFEQDPFIAGFMEDLVGPAKVIPAGSNAEAIPPKVVIPFWSHLIDEAYLQLDEGGAITGIVSRYTNEEMIDDVMLLFVDEVDDQGQAEDGAYRLTPMMEADAELARNMFLFAGFLASVGLVICGSGGPSFYTVWYAPLPSLISLVGYPMRYGRAGNGTRVAYAVIGVLLMGFGYKLMAFDGNFGAGTGSPLDHAWGFAALFTGLAAVLAVPFQIIASAWTVSIEGTPRKKEVRMSWEQACSLEPVEREIDYEDEVLAKVDTIPLSGELRDKAETLEAAGFTKAQHMHWQREEGLAAATIQLGCRKLVVSDLEYENESDEVEVGLISVLGTGLTIITVSANSRFKKGKSPVNCLFRQSASSEPEEMLAGHLEVVVSEAEDRDTVVVEILESETDDVVQLARRALADIQAAPGQVINVGPRRYGRFSYPPAPVPDLEVPETV
ncbi:MAG: hypothetical protein AAFX06_17725 [Planctomycetota bacterium]